MMKSGTTMDDPGQPRSFSAGSLASAAKTWSPRDFLRFLNRQKWLIACVVCVILGGTVFVLSQITPLYSAGALLMLDARKTKVANFESVVSGATVDATAVQNEIEIIRSRSMAIKVVDKLGLLADPEFNSRLTLNWQQQILDYLGLQKYGEILAGPTGSADRNKIKSEVVDKLIDRVSVTPRGRSFVISVRGLSSDPAKAAKIANTVADFNLVDQLETKFEITRRATDWLNDKLGDLRDKVEASEKAVANFRDKYKLTEARGATVVAQQIGEINSQLTLAKATTAEREARLKQIQDLLKGPSGIESAGEVLSSPLIQRFREQEADLARREGELATRYGANHPRMLNVRAEAADLKRKIQDEVAKIAQAQSNEVKVAQARQSALQQQLDRLERQSGDLGQASVQLRQLEREAESNRLIYQGFLNRFKESREQEDLQQADARIVSSAEIPVSAAYPRYGLTLVLALLVSFIVAGALAYAVERLDVGFRSAVDVEEATGLAALGVVPLIPGGRVRMQRPHDYITSKPVSSYTEALRSVYTAITLGTIDRPAQTIMITSALPGEGKSTFCVSLGCMLAKTGAGKRRVLVIDLDLRRPAIARILGLKPKATLQQMLLGEASLEDILIVESKTGLHVIGASKAMPNPTDVLDSDKLRDFIAGLTTMYDLILIDTPPIGAVSDAKIIGTLVDQIVYLVKWGATPRDIVLESVLSLRQVGKRIGVVLSQMNPRIQSRYGGYGSYYGSYKKYYRS